MAEPAQKHPPGSVMNPRRVIVLTTIGVFLVLTTLAIVVANRLGARRDTSRLQARMVG